MKRGPRIETNYYLSKTKTQKLDRLALQINERIADTTNNIFMIGWDLSKAKSILPHGSFQTWIDECFYPRLPYSTAICLKSIYEAFNGNKCLVNKFPLTFLIALKQSLFPKSAKELIIKNWKRVSVASSDQILLEYAKYKKNRLSLEAFNDKIAQEFNSIRKSPKRKKWTIEKGIQEIENNVERIKKAVLQGEY